MMQREWEEKERWAGMNCGRRELWVRSAVVFFHLLFHQQTKKLNPRHAPSFTFFTHHDYPQGAPVQRIDIRVEEGREVGFRLAVLESELLLSVRITNPPQLEEI